MNVKTKMGDPTARRVSARSLGNTSGLKIYEDKDDTNECPFRRSMGGNLRKPAYKPPIPTRKSLAPQPISKRASVLFGDQENKLANGIKTIKLGITKEKMMCTDNKEQTTDVPLHKSGRVGRKSLADIGNLNGYQNKSKKNSKTVPKIPQAGKGCALTTRRVEDVNAQSSKSLSGKDATRTKLTRKSIMTVQALGQTKLKPPMARKSSLSIRTDPSSSCVTLHLDKEKKCALESISAKACLVISSKSSLNKSEECSAESGNAITTVITRPKLKKRRSFTSMLMAQSKADLPTIDDSRNELEVSEYVDDIYWFYWNMERQSPSLENYMDIQTEITPKTRLLDKFLSVNVIKRKDMQLVGLTTLLIASKYEDFWHPRIRDLISISANSCTSVEMISMERFIINKLKFRLNLPTPYVFMKRFLKAAQADPKLEHLSFYLVELCQIEYESLIFKASLLCAAAIYLARCTLRKSPAWTTLLRKHAHYEETDLRPCAEMILRLHRAASAVELTVSHEKYLSSEYNSVAAIRPMDSLPIV